MTFIVDVNSGTHFGLPQRRKKEKYRSFPICDLRNIFSSQTKGRRKKKFPIDYDWVGE